MFSINNIYAEWEKAIEFPFSKTWWVVCNLKYINTGISFFVIAILLKLIFTQYNNVFN